MIAVDIGGSHISSVEILDIKKGKIATQTRRNKVQILNRKSNEILNDWARNINLTINKSKFYDGKIAIAFPGPLDYSNGIVLAHQNGKFKPLEGLNIMNELKDRIKHCRLIHFENDAASFGIGEYHFGPQQNDKKVIAITIGSGIGSTFIDTGNVIRSRQDVPKGGEVYYLPFKEQTADDYFSTRWFIHEASKLNLSIKGVKELIESGNALITKSIFSNFAYNFSQFFTPIALNFQADTLIIGGNIAKSWEYFGPKITSTFALNGIKIRQSKLGEQAICLGAAKSMTNTFPK